MESPTQLHANSLGVTESTIMGIAGTAPAYSIEITTSTIIATAGVLSPASILACGLIMFGIAFAFINLNRALASAGTSYSWVTMVFGKSLGFFAGWALLVLCCVFMVSAMIPAANATLLIFKPELMNNVHYVTVIAALWLTAVSLVVVKGIKLTSYVQVIMTPGLWLQHLTTRTPDLDQLDVACKALRRVLELESTAPPPWVAKVEVMA